MAPVQRWSSWVNFSLAMTAPVTDKTSYLEVNLTLIRKKRDWLRIKTIANNITGEHPNQKHATHTYRENPNQKHATLQPQF